MPLRSPGVTGNPSCPGLTDAVVAGYLAACARSWEAAAAAGSLDDTAPHPRAGEVDLRWILLHMIRHNGHADVIRELLDGTTGD